MRTHTTQGIIIHRAAGRDADRIITLLTREGTRAVVAVSARKLTSRKTGSLELFNEVNVILRETNHLPIIEEVEMLRGQPDLRENLEGLERAFWAAQLVVRLVREEEATADLYLAFGRYLGDLGRLSAVIEFELELLGHLGWSPEVEHCVVCRKSLLPDTHVWCHGHGGVTHPGCRDEHAHEPISVDGLKLLRFLIRQGGSHTTLRFPERIQAEVEGILERYLQVMADQPELKRMYLVKTNVYPHS